MPSGDTARRLLSRMKPLEQIAAFARSPHHAWLALLTLGAGAATLSSVGLVAGAAAYLLGWIYLPGSRWFRTRLALRHRAGAAAQDDEVRAFVAKRREIYESLPPASRKRYDAFAARIEETLVDLARSPGLNEIAVQERSRRLATLGWTYLRLLTTEEALGRFLASEAPDDLRREIEELEAGLAAINAAERPRLADSKQARLDSLRARLEKRLEAESSRDLVRAEQERIVDLVKLMQAEHLSSRDSSALSGEIDGAAYFLDQTSDWLRDSEFDSSPADVSESVTGMAPLSISE